MAHLYEQGLLFDQAELLEIICMHKGRLNFSNYYCPEALLKYRIVRYSDTSKESRLLVLHSP